MARLVGATAHLGQKRLPFVARLAVIVPVGAGMLAAMVEEADVVGLALQRPDLALDEGVELPKIGRNLRGNVEIHGAAPPVNAINMNGCSPGILRSRQVDPEAAAAAFCRQADGVA